LKTTNYAKALGGVGGVQGPVSKSWGMKQTKPCPREIKEPCKITAKWKNPKDHGKGKGNSRGKLGEINSCSLQENPVSPKTQEKRKRSLTPKKRRPGLPEKLGKGVTSGTYRRKKWGRISRKRGKAHEKITRGNEKNAKFPEKSQLCTALTKEKEMSRKNRRERGDWGRRLETTTSLPRDR